MKNKALLALLLSFCVFLPALAQTKPAAPRQPQFTNDKRVLSRAVDLEPEFYYLQVVITDKDVKGKAVPLVQWIDFEIVKSEPNGRGK